MTTASRWYTVAAVAERLHVRPITAWRRLKPYRLRCHLARNGSHPRRVLWVPADVVRALERAQKRAA